MDQLRDIQQTDFFQLKAEKEAIQAELENLKLYFAEIEATNNHLISATWREREMKKKLAMTIAELNSTKLIVEKQNTRITESINYSKKIQTAINPAEEDIRKHFEKSFMIYMPKDVISGDFPWTFEKGDYFYVAAVDCTGHGVPGAMMSMIGNLLLKHIVKDEETHTPATILKRLHEAVVQTLKQDMSSSNSNDGMDLAMCRIHKKTKELCFSGAHRPLFYLKNKVVEVIGGDKFPIGGMHYRGKNNYTDTFIKYDEGDSIFVFTDGYPDQIGGPEGKKVMTKNVKALIDSKADEGIESIREELVNFYHSWKGEHKQVDDILVIGINL